MLVNKNEKRVAVDVDDTLLLWDGNYYQPKEETVKIACPYEEGMFFYLKPHKHHINLLKAKKARGYEITVWSQNGWAWAEQAVKVLGLEDFVDRVETKFDSYFDDLPANEWMSRIYLRDIEEKA